MKIKNIFIKDLKIIKTKSFFDKRGFFKEVFKSKLIKKNFIFLVSDITKLMFYFKKKNISFDINCFLDTILEVIGTDGTLVLPTYNWDFCKGKDFCYHKTLSLSGSLGNFALKRHDFLRTQNPIYSFAVAGKDKDKLFNFKHKSCFGLDSPFGYLIN